MHAGHTPMHTCRPHTHAYMQATHPYIHAGHTPIHTCMQATHPYMQTGRLHTHTYMQDTNPYIDTGRQATHPYIVTCRQATYPCMQAYSQGERSATTTRHSPTGAAALHERPLLLLLLLNLEGCGAKGLDRSVAPLCASGGVVCRVGRPLPTCGSSGSSGGGRQ